MSTELGKSEMRLAVACEQLMVLRSQWYSVVGARANVAEAEYRHGIDSEQVHDANKREHDAVMRMTDLFGNERMKEVLDHDPRTRTSAG